ncbi:hypothetical protein QZH41_001333 [Actinostola sp. cb2023]|nr:hypothetical protein QZH41_001333 [Actinostola sp. cb2023]
MYATGNDSFPVEIFQAYLEHRPAEMRSPDSPLYLATVKNAKTNTWFKRQPLGVHSLGSFMKQMTANADIPGKHTNHSARRTMITTLRHENINPLDISQLSGHKNLKSIDCYSSVSEEQQKHMSLAISRLSSSGPRAALSTVSVNQNRSTTSTASSSVSPLDSAFSGAVFNQCTFNIGGSNATDPVVVPKRRRYVIESDEEDECLIA